MSSTRVLFVCLGNICRSPAAEGVFVHLLEQQGLSDRFVVDSAGTGGWHVGRRADERMRAAAKRRGIALTSRARQLALGDLHSFDHIVTMDAANLAAVRALALEAGKPDGQARISAMTDYCRIHSSTLEVPDPYYGGPQGFEHVLDLLEDACSGLLEELR
jgi:protein-tyrosine phosphatase